MSFFYKKEGKIGLRKNHFRLYNGRIAIEIDKNACRSKRIPWKHDRKLKYILIRCVFFTGEHSCNHEFIIIDKFINLYST